MRIQQAVDQGQKRWRLNPVRTAQVVGKLFGLEDSDQYELTQIYISSGSGLHHATVRVKHGPCKYVLDLYQPIRQGSDGIWILQRIIPL